MVCTWKAEKEVTYFEVTQGLYRVLYLSSKGHFRPLQIQWGVHWRSMYFLVNISLHSPLPPSSFRWVYTGMKVQFRWCFWAWFLYGFLKLYGRGMVFYQVFLLSPLQFTVKWTVATLKGHGNEADFLGFLQKWVRHRFLALNFEPFRFGLRIRGDIRNRKTTPRLAESGSRQECL
jgi:hypothetical protein